MALVPYYPDPDILLPGVRQFARALQYFDPAGWAETLFSMFRHMLYNYISREGPRQIGWATTQVATEMARRSATVGDALARFFENARWAVTAVPRNIYTALEDYYRELPSVRPTQARQLAERLGAKIPEQINIYKEREEEVSGEFVRDFPPPGGAQQRTAPDWLLPFLLGLYGDIPPAWESRLRTQVRKAEEEEEDGPQKKKPRSSASAKTPNTRRNRSVGSKKRRR
ncbi:VP3 [Betapolyomavirus equi]|nr:VP3 [Betapolyomavirus equi]AFK09339.1 VP3 [Betapolyomavirus equi]